MQTIVSAFAAILMASSAAAATIDFTDATCNGGGTCFNEASLDQS